MPIRGPDPTPIDNQALRATRRASIGLAYTNFGGDALCLADALSSPDRFRPHQRLSQQNLPQADAAPSLDIVDAPKAVFATRTDDC
jgi:hypothetical protein